MIDCDATPYVEYADGTRDPVALIETAIDVGHAEKTATVTARLAMRAKLPAFTVLYKLSASPNPAYVDVPDIASFRVRMIHPSLSEWHFMTCQRYARFLQGLRYKKYM